MSEFYWFDKKQLFKQIQILLRIWPFSNLLRETNFPSISVLLSEIVIFLTKKRSFQWISPKMLQNNREAYFSCMWLILRRKTVFVTRPQTTEIWTLICCCHNFFSPYFCADNFITSLLLIVWCVRWYVKSLYRPFL